MRRDFTVRGLDCVSYLLIAPMMACLRNSPADIVVRCVDAQMGSVPELLQAGRIEFAIEVMHPIEDPVRSQSLIRERYVVIIAAQHPAIEAGGQLGCGATGGVAIAASPLLSGRACQRTPVPPQCPLKRGSIDEDNASMFEPTKNDEH